jgi:hypothetical protein
MAEDLVGKVINFFSGENTENMSDKEVVLRQRHKELSENKYAKFYKLKTDEVDPSLGQFFYSLYKMILPVRTFMKDTAKIDAAPADSPGGLPRCLHCRNGQAAQPGPYRGAFQGDVARANNRRNSRRY